MLTAVPLSEPLKLRIVLAPSVPVVPSYFNVNLASPLSISSPAAKAAMLSTKTTASANTTKRVDLLIDSFSPSLLIFSLLGLMCWN